MIGRFVLSRGFVGGAFAFAAGVIATLVLAAALQYLTEVRHEQAGVPAPSAVPAPSRN